MVLALQSKHKGSSAHCLGNLARKDDSSRWFSLFGVGALSFLQCFDTCWLGDKKDIKKLCHLSSEVFLWTMWRKKTTKWELTGPSLAETRSWNVGGIARCHWICFFLSTVLNWSSLSIMTVKFSWYLFMQFLQTAEFYVIIVSRPLQFFMSDVCAFIYVWAAHHWVTTVCMWNCIPNFLFMLLPLYC